MYELTISDFEEIESLVKTISSIDNLYNRLYDLEVNNQKETEEYQRLLKELISEVNNEEKQYNEYNLDFDKCTAWLNYLSGSELSNISMTDFESIVNQNYSDRIIRRITKVLIKKIISDYQKIKEMLPEEITSIINELDFPNKDEIISQSIYSSTEVQLTIEIDILMAYLTFLEDYLNKNEPYRLDLISSKYNAAFINKDIEKTMISNNFNIPSELYINSKFVADLTKMNPLAYDLTIGHHATKVATNQIVQIIEINDTDYKIPKRAVTSILRQCMMRAAFLFMDNESISGVNSIFHEVIESEIYLSKCPNNTITESAVINCFKSIKRDRNKLRILSFGKRNN